MDIRKKGFTLIEMLVVITIIGIPLAGIIFGVWLIALFMGKILAGIVIGRLLLKKTKSI